jgi:hypothetical protein
MRVSVCLRVAAVLFAALIAVPPAEAAETQCKGLKSEACSSNSGCSWVKPYKTKAGRDVAGFCRKKAGKKAG